MNYSSIISWLNQNQGLIAVIIFLLGSIGWLIRVFLSKSATSPISIIEGEHHAKGKGIITGIDAHESVVFKPGTKSIAEGEGIITATRIAYKKNLNEEVKK